MTTQSNRRQDSQPVVVSEHAVLVKNYIEAVLIEVRFSSATELLDSGIAFQLQSALAGVDVDLPKIEQLVQNEIAMTVTAGTVTPKSEIRGRGWQLQNTDGTFSINLMPNLLAIQMSNYERWSVSMAPLLEPIFSVLQSSLSPDVVKRVGVRFINRMRKSGAISPLSWRGSIDDRFLGIQGDNDWGNLILGSQQFIEMKVGDSDRVVVRHGLFRDGSDGDLYDYLVDIDAFREVSEPFSVATLAARCSDLDRVALGFFQKIVTAEMRKNLGETSVAVASDITESEDSK